MKHTFLGLLILFTATAKAEISTEMLESFRNFARKDIVMFGAPKDVNLILQPSNLGYSIYADGEQVGSSETYERCLGRLENGDLKLSCHDGITASIDICKIKPKPDICARENMKTKIREVYMDPNILNGDLMRGLGQQKTNPYTRHITTLAKHYPSARKAIARAMEINGCQSVELGDIAGQTTYMDQQALADEDTNQVFEGAKNRYRTNLHCRSGSQAVYLDVVNSAEQGVIKLSLVPLKALEEAGVVIGTMKPVLGTPKTTAAATF